jgi:hypothetical protein
MYNKNSKTTTFKKTSVWNDNRGVLKSGIDHWRKLLPGVG